MTELRKGHEELFEQVDNIKGIVAKTLNVELLRVTEKLHSNYAKKININLDELKWNGQLDDCCTTCHGSGIISKDGKEVRCPSCFGSGFAQDLKMELYVVALQHHFFLELIEKTIPSLSSDIQKIKVSDINNADNNLIIFNHISTRVIEFVKENEDKQLPQFHKDNMLVLLVHLQNQHQYPFVHSTIIVVMYKWIFYNINTTKWKN